MADHRSQDAGLPTPEATLVEAAMMLLAVVPVMISAYASLVTGDGQWFQRSGALMVLFSIGVEYHRSKVQCYATGNTGTRSAVTHILVASVRRFWKAVPFVCYLSIVTGTLIWSYGDLLFRG
ncbi:hypothetical protein [Halomonas ramblicola]|uniref:hypothetical protein n=1 Tax=Halomonas ramblicola TaxID=747349 RepID=UPI0025B2F526|nr:hypothetical protein [Halomonas ramblicola]MDN3520299.1 hypothetical protein [Halomonas ramblicola]